MKTKLCARLLALALTALLLTASLPVALAAAGDGPAQTNPETGFSVYILDDDDLLSPAEESLLLENMYPITAYGTSSSGPPACPPAATSRSLPGGSACR